MSLKRETEEREACPALEELQCCAGGGQWGHREEGEVCSLPASPGSLRDGGRMGGLLEGSQMEVARGPGRGVSRRAPVELLKLRVSAMAWAQSRAWGEGRGRGRRRASVMGHALRQRLTLGMSV